MSIRIFILQLLFILGIKAFAQNTENVSSNQHSIPFKKLYLHTDREFYFSGDTLRFAAYLVDGQTQKFEWTSCNLYIDLINAEGKIVLDELFILENGFCSGYVPFADSAVSEGNFLLRASTDYLKNFGDDAFFTKTIRVSSVKNSFELQESEGFTPGSSDGFTQSETLNKNNPDISFLPEGGFLLAEESNCVAFKAIDENGFGITISGKLLDENGNLVLTFKSIYKGAGKFYFYPKAGKKYTAKINGFPNLEFSLPEIKETGAKIKLVNQEDEKIQIAVQSNQDNRNLPYHLICYHRNEFLFTVEIDRKKANQIIKINGELLKDGINRFVLFDKKHNPLSERLVFKESNSISRFDVRLGEENYATREQVQLNIKAEDLIDEMAQVSISVVDENYVNASGVSQNIASYLLLDSELKGHIDSPADYFNSKDSIASQTKLDLLMCTNGWSNYIWNSFIEDPVEIKFKPQLGFTFTGNVKRFAGKKVLSEGNVSMILFKSDSTSAFFDQPLDLNGHFEFRNIVFYDSASVFAQARNKRDNHGLQFEMQMPEFVSPDINSSDLSPLNNFSSIPYSLYRQSYLNEMRLREFYPDKNNILVEEVEVKAKKPRPEFKTGTPKKNDGPYLVTWEMMAGSFDIVEFLAFKVPGIWPVYNDNGTMLVSCHMNLPAELILDGFLRISYDEARSYNPDAFESIEILTPPASNFYRAPGGAILLTFRKGRQVDPASIPLLGGIVERINGFTPLREFYSPKYAPQNVNSEAPDFRNTLYWNPKVTVGNGEKELFFFTCDNLSRYKIFVEGITESGKICLGTGWFEVDRFRLNE